MKQVLFQVNHLQKYYKSTSSKLFSSAKHVHAVKSVSFDIYEGETFGLVGESGSGKSTIGQLLIRLIPADGGDIYFKGESLFKLNKKELKEKRKDIQIVFQDPYASLNPKKKIGWILEEPLIIHRLGSSSERQQRVLSILRDVGLDETFLLKYPHELSGGQRQRIGIASALILNPTFLVIDEAVSALDVSVQSQILNLLKELQRKYQLTYFFISHDLNVIQYFCDRIGVMYQGELLEVQSTEELMTSPRHPYTQSLFSAIPTIPNTKNVDVVTMEQEKVLRSVL